MAMETNFFQLFIRLLDHKTLTLQFPINQHPKSQSQFLTAQSIKQQLETLTNIPIQYQTLTLNGKSFNDDAPISPSLALSTLSLSVPLHGGKGGFGSLLRGAVTKAGQKKTNNFDACRDMSGRRLRHVNAEKKLEEWKAEEEDRRLEKQAEEYLKKAAKKARKEGRSDGTDKYVEKYRMESERCVKEVERSVRESVGELMVGKKKKLIEKLKAKKKADGAGEEKLNIWMGKRKLVDTESDDSDDDDEGENDLENDKSVVIDGGNQSDSSKEDKQGSGSVSVEKMGGECYAGGSSESGCEEGMEMAGGNAEHDDSPHGRNEGSSAVEPSLETVGKIGSEEEKKYSPADTVISTSLHMEIEGQCGPDSVQEEVVAEDNGVAEAEPANLLQDRNSEAELPLNFDDFISATSLEVLGMERLKSELQACGLKCGGTLQERAARLFLLKTTPLDKLPKKLLAKK